MKQKDISIIENKYQIKNIPELKIGDIVNVHYKIREGEKERIQIFKGTLISKRKKGGATTITVRKISFGVGVERIFPIYSPSIDKIQVVRHSHIRRSKLYYLRKRVGKSAKLRQKQFTKKSLSEVANAAEYDEMMKKQQEPEETKQTEQVSEPKPENESKPVESAEKTEDVQESKPVKPEKVVEEPKQTEPAESKVEKITGNDSEKE